MNQKKRRRLPRQKATRMLWVLSVILSLAITSGCRTTKNVIVLPPVPERTEQPEPESLKDVALLLSYYEFLIEEWEAWGKAVTEQVAGCGE